MNPFQALTHPFCSRLTLLGFYLIYTFPLKHRNQIAVRMSVVICAAVCSAIFSFFYPIQHSWMQVIVHSLGTFCFVVFCSGGAKTVCVGHAAAGNF